MAAGQSFPMKPKRDYIEETDPEEIMKSLEKTMFQALETPNPIENLQKLIKKARGMEGFFDQGFRDYLGFTLLGNAVKLRLLKVVSYLVEEENFLIKEELIIAVEMNYKDAVEYFLNYDPDLVNRPVLAGTVCRPGSSPVMIASLKENEHMLKYLFSRGAQPLRIPRYDPRELQNIIRFDAIYQTMVALSKPMYLCIMNEDPVMVSFKISEGCEDIASIMEVARNDMIAIKDSCEKFASGFIKNVATFEDLDLMLSQMTTEEENLVVPGEPFERLKYAMINNHSQFVANGNIQKLITKLFFAGPLALQDFHGSNSLVQALYLLFLSALTPLWIFFYLFIPVSETPTGKLIKDWMEMPLMRFIVQFNFYLIVLIVAVYTSVHTNNLPMEDLRDINDLSIQLKRFELARVNGSLDFTAFGVDIDVATEAPLTGSTSPMPEEVIEEEIRDRVFAIYKETMTNDTNTYLADFYIFMWTIGNSYKEIQTIYVESFASYSSDWVNILNILLNICFFTSTIIKYSFIVDQGEYSPIDVNQPTFGHPLALADSIRALGVMFLCFKSYKLLRLTGLVGRPQLIMGEAFNASFYFFVFFFCSLTAFSVSANGLIFNPYYQYWVACTNDPDGSYINVPCATREFTDNKLEMKNYQDVRQVIIDFFFAMFQSNTRLQFNFPYYINSQEIILSLMYAIYAFFMIVVRLNILISLIIFAVLEASKYEEQEFKFRRTYLYFMFIGGADPTPSPFNIIPSVRPISEWFQASKKEKHKLFTEDELEKVELMRTKIRVLKNTYLREMKKQKRDVVVSRADAEKLKKGIRLRCGGLATGVDAVHHRTEELLRERTKKKRAAAAAAKDGSIQEAIQENTFMQRYQATAKGFFT